MGIKLQARNAACVKHPTPLGHVWVLHAGCEELMHRHFGLAPVVSPCVQKLVHLFHALRLHME